MFVVILYKKLLVKVFIILPSLIASIAILLQSSKEGINAIFDIISSFLIVPYLLFSLIVLIIYMIKNKNIASIFILLAFIIVFGTSFRDIYYLNNGLLPYSWSVPYGFMALVISIFFILAIEQSRVYIQSLNSSKDLKNKNESLKNMMDKINVVSKSLIESSKK